MNKRNVGALSAALVFALLAAGVYWATHRSDNEADTLPSDSEVSTPAGIPDNGSGDWEIVTTPLAEPTYPPGWAKYGNCWIKGDVTEVFTEAAAARGGRVFDAKNERYYSLPNGGCVTLMAQSPYPDWVRPGLEAPPTLIPEAVR